MSHAWSKHNLVSPIPGTDKVALLNLLRGEADILTKEMAAPLLKGEKPEHPDFETKGYWVDPTDEAGVFRQKYLDFLDRRDREEVQIFFVPWYTCNFACPYCFQDQYEPSEADLSDDRLTAFFEHVDRAFAGRRKYLTLFGGEPLLPGEKQRDYIRRFLGQATGRGLDVAIVTNGHALAEYVDLLSAARIREIQVTLDGPESIHDARRPLRGARPTFQSIVHGIDLALAAGFSINLRMVVDKRNLGSLPELARFAIDRGWTDSPRFKTQLGRNYELHHCQTTPDDLFRRAELHEHLFALAARHPEILRFHRPAFSVVRFLRDNGALPDPLFDACPGTKTEWAFDSSGRIFACTATVGKASEVLGTYHPVLQLDETKISEWNTRDVTTVEACGTCPSRLACGGGCAAVARNRTGHLHGADCRPIPELVGLGMAHYFPQEVRDV